MASILASLGGAIISLKHQMVSIVNAAHEALQAVLLRYTGLFDQSTLLVISWSWMSCYAQMWLMNARDACCFLRLSGSEKYPRVHRTLDDVSRNECQNMTGFS